MKNTVFTFILFLLVSIISAQNIDFMTSSGQDSGSFFGSNQMLDGGRFASLNGNISHGNIGIKGSPLLFNNFVNDGVLWLTSGKSYAISHINIDLDNGHFVSELSKDSIFIFNNVKVAKVKSKVYTQNSNKIYEVLQNGTKISFLKQISKVLKRQIQDKLTAEVVKWKLVEEYYIKINGDFNLINLRKKDFYKFIEKDKVNDLKKYIKSNRLSPKKETDLITIIGYYNTL